MKKLECNKEIKVKIEQVKCIKYKTFQPELLTKKFMFSDELQTIHKLKLLSEDSSDQNKATTFHSDKEIVKAEKEKEIEKEKEKEKKEEEEEEKEQQEEPEEEEPKAISGRFRDNIRRIDLVLVVEDDVNKLLNDIKIEFLTYIVKAGLEVEIEPGVMKMHENLTFIKIHAPDSVLEKYGKFFGTKRYFADTRYDYMDRTKSYEKEWVRFVRGNYETPYGYSNYERSIIVYKILLHLPFGDNANCYGIERLLNRKVIIDVFALHDGPYFITPDQTISGFNARQILNYYWSSIQNIFRQQPIHLIHEYLGPRVAIYFTFYEFFIKALKLAAFFGILNTVLGKKNLDDWEKNIKKDVCENKYHICWPCKDCLHRLLKEYCKTMDTHLILDHEYVPLYLFITVIGSFIFVRLWQRKEYFLKWIWEVGGHNSYSKNAVRPLFDVGFGPRIFDKDPPIRGLKYRESLIPIFLRNFLSKIIIILYWFTFVPLMLKTYALSNEFYKNMQTEERYYGKYRDYIVLSLFQTLYIALMTVFEKIYHHIVYFIVKCENHSSHKKFNKSIVVKKIGFRMLYQYALISYYAWIYGRQPRYDLCVTQNLTPYQTYLNLMYIVYGYETHEVCNGKQICFPFTCIIEAGTLLATLLIVTQVVYKMFDYVFNLRTDYNVCTYKKSDIPCWEREYRLSSWTEEDMIRKYINLAAQFTLVTWFVIAFPIGPLILYVMNVWHIRHEARKLLLASRRPLLIKTPGTQMTNVFYFIASVAVITNAINITSISRTGLRYLMYKLGKTEADLFHHIHYYHRNPACYAPDLMYYLEYTSWYTNLFGVYHDGHWWHWLKGYEEYTMFYLRDYFYLLIFKMYHCILFVLATACVLPIIFYAIPHHLQKEKKLRAIEEKIKNLYYHYEYEYEYILK